MLNEDIFSNTRLWKRGGLALLFMLIYSFSEAVVWLLLLFQFGTLLFTGKPNPFLLNVSQGFNTYIYQVLQYITFKSDEAPFPFKEWPTGTPGRS